MAGISKKTINGTTTAVSASVRTAKGQPWIFGPATHKMSVMQG
jgi:hypothetical protein